MSLSALSMARTANAAQSSSGEEQTAIAAVDATEAGGTVGEFDVTLDSRCRACQGGWLLSPLNRAEKAAAAA